MARSPRQSKAEIREAAERRAAWEAARAQERAEAIATLAEWGVRDVEPLEPDVAPPSAWGQITHGWRVLVLDGRLRIDPMTSAATRHTTDHVTADYAGGWSRHGVALFSTYALALEAGRRAVLLIAAIQHNQLRRRIV